MGLYLKRESNEKLIQDRKKKFLKNLVRIFSGCFAQAAMVNAKREL